MNHDVDSYEHDFVLWMEKQAQLLRAGRLDALDVEHLTEELEAMAGKERRELRSHLTDILVHLLRCRYQPARNMPGWIATLGEHRTQISLQLEDSPSLGLRLVEFADRAYATAVRRAALETGLDVRAFPASNPFTINEILDLYFIGQFASAIRSTHEPD